MKGMRAVAALLLTQILTLPHPDVPHVNTARLRHLLSLPETLIPPPPCAALARCFSLKVGILPERVLPTLLEDRLVAKGTVLAFVTDFFADVIATDGVEALLEVLRKVRDGRLAKGRVPCSAAGRKHGRHAGHP